ncbi:MAG: alanine dehydrogenase [Chlorobi bacterium]|nr:alanine dehydrogenase [Chlorobiota bacterium]
MKIALIRERKNPPDRRVVLTPAQAQKVKEMYPQVDIVVESSPDRAFSDEEYRAAGITVTDDVSDADVLMGVKEVPPEALIPDKKYFFFSHTIKKQPHNRPLLRAVLDKNIELYDHETLTDKEGRRLVAFGKYAGQVGAYNALRTYGLKTGLFDLPKAIELGSKEEMIRRLREIYPQLPPLKIVVTGKGRVGSGIKEILDAAGIREVEPRAFLDTEDFGEPVYTQIDVDWYNKHKEGKPFDFQEFFTHPERFEGDFGKFTKAADLYIAGHYYGQGAPPILTREHLAAPDNRIKVVADVSCDIGGPIASTIRASTIEDPVYGYDPATGKETDYRRPEAVAVMAVDNLPNEIARDASEGFGENFVRYIIPALVEGDKDGILERAKITSGGRLTPRYAYLQDYADGKE